MSMTRRLSALAAALLIAAIGLVGAGEAAMAADTPFRVISYNACGSNTGGADRKDYACSFLNVHDRAPSVADLNTWATRLKSQILTEDGKAPDVLMLQELCAGQRELIREQLATLGTYRVVFHSVRNHGACAPWANGRTLTDSKADGTAIFVRTGAALPRLSEELTEIDPTVSPELRRHLLCTTAAVGGRDSLICNLHAGPSLHDEGAPQAMAAIKRWAGNRPVIFGGDLNADPFDPNLNVYYGIEGGTGPFTEVDQANEPYFNSRCFALAACRSGPDTMAGRKFDYLFGTSTAISWTGSKSIKPVTGSLTYEDDHFALRGDAIWKDETTLPAVPYLEVPSTGVHDAGLTDSLNWTGVRDATIGRFTGGDDRDDLIVRRWSGDVHLYPGTGGRLGAATLLRTADTGWTDVKRMVSGEFTGDGDDDVMILRSSGTIDVYPGDNAGGLGAPTQPRAANFFSDAADITAGEFTGDGIADLAVQWTSGRLFIYPGQPGGALGGSINMSDAGFLSAAAPKGMMTGDIDHDGRTDLVVRRKDGSLVAYPVTPTSTGTPVLGAADELQPATPAALQRPLFEAVGDLTGDRNDDLIVRWADDSTRLNPYPAPATSINPDQELDLATAGHGIGMFTATHLAGGDLDGDGDTDLMMRQRWDNAQVLLANGDGTFVKRDFGPKEFWTKVLSLVIGDYTRDGKADVVVRRTDGVISVYPGDGAGGVSATAVTVANPAGGGWAAAEEVVGGEFTGDAHEDLVVRWANGDVHLFPNTGAGRLGTRVVLREGQAGWGDALSMTVADFTADSRDDILVRWHSGRGFLYPGTGAGIGGSSEYRPIGALNAAAAIVTGSFTGGTTDTVVKWSDGSVRLYPATTATSEVLNVRSFDGQSGVSHFEYAADAGSTWTRVPAHFGAARITPASGIRQLRVVAVDKAGNRSAEAVFPR